MYFSDTFLGVTGSLMMILLHIFCRVYQRKNFENTLLTFIS